MQTILRIFFVLLFCGLPAFGQNSPITRVDSISQLRALRIPSVSSKMTAVVAGYSSSNDGGGGTFVYDSSSVVTDDDGVYIKPTSAGGRWVRQFGGWLNAKWFGAIGDGSDVTDELKAAVAVAKLYEMGVYAPRGNYVISDTIDLRNSGDNSSGFGGIVGDGVALTVFTMDGTNLPIFRFWGRGGKYSDFKVQYATQQTITDTNSTVFRAEGFLYYHSFKNIELLNGYTGIKTEALSGSTATIFSCNFDDIIIRNFVYRGVNIVGSSGNQWDNIYLSNPGIDACDTMFYDLGASTYGQFNLEHSNIRVNAATFLGDGQSFQRLHLEGLRTLTDGPLIDPGSSGMSIGQMNFVNNYLPGHFISAITKSGATATATVDMLGQAVVGGHGFRVGDSVTIAGATDALYTGAKTVTSITSSNFTYTMSGTPAADAAVNFAGGQDYIWAYFGSFPAPSLFIPVTYTDSKVKVDLLTLRNNKLLGNNTATRDLTGLLLAREFGGRRSTIEFNAINQGNPFNTPRGDNQNGFVPIIASSRSANVSTIYFQYPHGLLAGEYMSISGGTVLNFGSNYIQVATVNDRYSVNVAMTGANAALTRETGNMIPVRAQITNRSRSGNVATLTTSVAHRFRLGDRVNIRGMSVGDYSDSETVPTAVPTSDTFSYTSVGPDEASTAETNGIVFELDSGLNVNLQSSATLSLLRAGTYFRPLLSLASATISAGTSNETLATVRGYRPGDSVILAGYNGSPLDPTLHWTCHASNDVVRVIRYNGTSGSITNGPTLVHVIKVGN